MYTFMYMYMQVFIVIYGICLNIWNFYKILGKTIELTSCAINSIKGDVEDINTGLQFSWNLNSIILQGRQADKYQMIVPLTYNNIKVTKHFRKQRQSFNSNKVNGQFHGLSFHFLTH